MKKVSKQELLRAAFKGMQNAERKFSALTANSLYLNRAPEYLMTVSVAETLGKTAPNHMTWLEYQLKNARSASRGGTPEIRPDIHTSHGRGNGRCDILMCWAASKEPRAAFEIKRDVQSLHKIKSDVERILFMMNGGLDGNTLQFGAVMFSTMAESAHGQKVIRDRVAQFRANLDDWRETLGAKNRRLNIISGGVKKRRAGDYWAPLALVAERIRPSA